MVSSVALKEFFLFLIFCVIHSRDKGLLGHLISYCKMMSICAACQCRAKVLAFLILVVGDRPLPFNKVTHTVGNSYQIEKKDGSSSIKRRYQTYK